MADLHRVFAVAETAVGLVKVPVSRPLAWDAAQDRWQRLDDANGFHWSERQTRIGAPRLGSPVPVRYYAVRSCDDPTWPQAGFGHPRARFLTRDRATGRFV